MSESTSEGKRIPRTLTTPLGSALLRAVEKEMRRPESRKAFEAWYLERYGKPYREEKTT